MCINFNHKRAAFIRPISHHPRCRQDTSQCQTRLTDVFSGIRPHGPGRWPPLWAILSPSLASVSLPTWEGDPGWTALL